jgi:hypothetical protein
VLTLRPFAPAAPLVVPLRDDARDVIAPVARALVRAIFVSVGGLLEIVKERRRFVFRVDILEVTAYFLGAHA